MHKSINFVVLILISAGFASAQPLPKQSPIEQVAEVAQQQTKSSRWRSSSGAIIDITTSDTWITVKVTPKQGQPSTWRGRWLRKYDLFEYDVNGQKHTAHMVKDNIKVTSPTGQVFNWSLMGVTGSGTSTTNSNYPNAQRITGRWSSSSGNVFDLSSKGSQVSVKAFMKDGRVLQTTGRWINQSSFTYQFSGFAAATVTLLNDGRVRVSAPGQPNTHWSKI